MVEKRKESHQMAENSKAQKAAPERRKGTFYLMLASWWPTTKGQKWLARKGVRKRLQALEEPQLSARQRTITHKGTHGNARVY